MGKIYEEAIEKINSYFIVCKDIKTNIINKEKFLSEKDYENSAKSRDIERKLLDKLPTLGEVLDLIKIIEVITKERFSSISEEDMLFEKLKKLDPTFTEEIFKTHIEEGTKEGLILGACIEAITSYGELMAKRIMHNSLFKETLSYIQLNMDKDTKKTTYEILCNLSQSILL